jgi:hypothetical protein
VCGIKDLGSTASNAALWVLLLTSGTERDTLTATTQVRTPKFLVRQDFQRRVRAQLDARCLAPSVRPQSTLPGPVDDAGESGSSAGDWGPALGSAAE